MAEQTSDRQREHDLEKLLQNRARAAQKTLSPEALRPTYDSPFLTEDGQLGQQVAGMWAPLWIGTASALITATFLPQIHVTLMRKGRVGSPTYWYEHTLRLAEMLQRILLSGRVGYQESLGQLLNYHQPLKNYDPIQSDEAAAYYGRQYGSQLVGMRLDDAFGDYHGKFGAQLLWVIGCTVDCWIKAGYVMLGNHSPVTFDPDSLVYDPGFHTFAERVYHGLGPLVEDVAKVTAGQLQFPSSYASLSRFIETIWDDYATTGNQDDRSEGLRVRQAAIASFGPRQVANWILDADLRHRSMTREWPALVDGILGPKRRAMAGRQEDWEAQNGRELFGLALADQYNRFAVLPQSKLYTPLYTATHFG